LIRSSAKKREKEIKSKKEDSLSVRFGHKNSRADVVVDARACAGGVNSIRANPIKRRSTGQHAFASA